MRWSESTVDADSRKQILCRFYIERASFAVLPSVFLGDVLLEGVRITGLSPGGAIASGCLSLEEPKRSRLVSSRSISVEAFTGNRAAETDVKKDHLW